VTAAGSVCAFRPSPGADIPLLPSRRWLAVIGAVGQPRDGDPAAAYALLNQDRATLTYWRVPYDCEAAAQKVRRAGLPEKLAMRLEQGR
jgi:diadenosine tetraphosphatase ApaH/serine/threonine PP2A family protein phosphatase